MRYQEKEMELQAVLATAQQMCAVARTAPKARGVDYIHTTVLTGEDKDQLAQKMEEISEREFADVPNIFARDAVNLKNAQAVVLVGVEVAYAGVPCCGLCGFGDCNGCEAAGGRCVFDGINLGIALDAAVEVAARNHIDNRIMYSVGRAACEMPYGGVKMMWHGIPLSASGKNIFFDRG